MELQIIIDFLEKSIQKNGEKHLTNVYLLNILKMSQRNKLQTKEYKSSITESDLYECINTNN